MEQLKLNQSEADILHNLVTHELEWCDECKENEPECYDAAYRRQLNILKKKLENIGWED